MAPMVFRKDFEKFNNYSELLIKEEIQNATPAKW